MRVLGSAAGGTAEPPPKQTESSGELRQRLLRTTAELVAKRGYPAVTLELIADRCGVSLKTFYRQFSSKEECFMEFFDTTVEAGRADVLAALAAEPDAIWPARVVIALRELFGQILADPIRARACIVEAPSVGRPINERYEAAMRSLSPLIRQGRNTSPQAEALPPTLEDTLAAGVLWSAQECLVVGELDRLESFLPEAVEFILRPYLGESEAATWAKRSQNQKSTPTSSTP
jgi:AcrR family transcriptional regulator